MDSKLKLALVILNFRGLNDTLRCLESVGKTNQSNMNLQTIVVDNFSQDKSAESLAKIKNIKFIRSSKNLGFSGGMNLGIKKALEEDADFVILLNNDTFIDIGFFQAIVKTIGDSDIASPKIYFAPGSEFHKDRYKKDQLGKVIWYAGGKIDWNNVIGVHRGVDEVDSGQYDQKKDIDLATGCCMIIKKTTIQKIGLLDEKYFLYLEDMDYCVRAKRKSLKINYLPKAVLWHKNASASGGSGSSLQDYYITRNRLLFAFKYAPLRTKIAVFKQVAFQISSLPRRQAFFDFLKNKYGQQG